MRSAIILSYHKSNRYRNMYPKCLIEINGQTLLNNQIEFLKKNGCNDINIIGGYKIDSLKNNKDVNVIYYQKYEQTSEVDVLRFALDKIYASSELFIMFGDVFVKPTCLTDGSSYILTHTKKCGIGCFTHNDKILRMSYDANDKWGKVLFLNSEAVKVLRKKCSNGQYFIFEIINLLIDNNCEFKRIDHEISNIETRKDFLNAQNSSSKPK